jgi:GT2 family glycosyltransferase
MLDNDMIYPSNTLMTMLGDKVDVVAGWACQRARPFYHNFLTPCDQGLYEVRKVLPTPPGLHEVGAVGACGMLIKREVLEAIEPPWFAFDTDEETGKPIGEDVYFCRKARKAGFKIYCRTDLRFGHMVTSLAFPNHDDDGNYTPEIQHGIY